MTVEADAFAEGQPIPQEYTCDGADIAPDLTIGSWPEESVTMAIIVEDPDASGGTFIHSVSYDIDMAGIPAGLMGLPADFGVRGVNSFGTLGYGGPCPPPGPAHRYFFRVYALDTTLGLTEGAAATALRAAMEGHVLAEAAVMGTYGR